MIFFFTQGLCTFYEKSSSDCDRKSLVDVYGKLLQMYSDADVAKTADTQWKLLELHINLGNMAEVIVFHHIISKF